MRSSERAQRNLPRGRVKAQQGLHERLQHFLQRRRRGRGQVEDGLRRAHRRVIRPQLVDQTGQRADPDGVGRRRGRRQQNLLDVLAPWEGEGGRRVVVAVVVAHFLVFVDVISIGSLIHIARVIAFVFAICPAALRRVFRGHASPVRVERTLVRLSLVTGFFFFFFFPLCERPPLPSCIRDCSPFFCILSAAAKPPGGSNEYRAQAGMPKRKYREGRQRGKARSSGGRQPTVKGRGKQKSI
ncbi:hypothetical protein DFJ73DRAFT_587666 [Zopfochytrium polystomum]|nr:hypothetical protein DFJ73DRAFT_587666 [Zopfochytrium polystomum]